MQLQPLHPQLDYTSASNPLPRESTVRLLAGNLHAELATESASRCKVDTGWRRLPCPRADALHDDHKSKNRQDVRPNYCVRPNCFRRRGDRIGLAWCPVLAQTGHHDGVWRCPF